MRTDQNIDLTLFQICQYAFHFRSLASPAKVFDPHRELLQPAAERLVMLKCQYGRRHQYRHLLVVGSSLECRTHGNLRLTKTHIAANKTVHRTFPLHIGFHLGGGFQLVGSIFVNERRFQFLLHKAVGRKSKTFFIAAGGIEFDQIAGNIFHLAFGLLFHPFPRTAAQFIDARCLTLFRPILR